MPAAPRRKTRGSASLPNARDMDQHAGAAAELLKALANSHRLLILCALGEGELSVGALNARISLSQSSLSQHLAVLHDEGLVDRRRESQTIYYSLRPGPALDVIRVLHGHFCIAARPERKRTGGRAS